MKMIKTNVITNYSPLLSFFVTMVTPAHADEVACSCHQLCTFMHFVKLLLLQARPEKLSV